MTRFGQLVMCSTTSQILTGQRADSRPASDNLPQVEFSTKYLEDGDPTRYLYPCDQRRLRTIQ